ncbi:hypothetical protein EWM64_g6292 [Hericium alpestre]|uniref:Arrestin-like N-terminal domain-containing protein n=1 Tax=Hericium alpestre TaxID=135208 RepID=A0A4Y9ZV25_9AGAM|nr:hypothetical protein EWM64_g6292 [Hericium alpestre]
MSDHELPEYSARGPLNSLSCRHKLVLDGAKERPWLTLYLRSRASSPKSTPLFFDKDVIKGKVLVDLDKPETIKGVSITLRAGITAVGQEEDVFLDKTCTLWSASDSSSSKLQGQHEWSFQMAIPNEPTSKSPRGRFPLPPSFSERASPTYIDYRFVVTVRRGVLRVNNTLTTSFSYLPRTVAKPPSMLRLYAYQEGSPLLGPDVDLEGWNIYPAVNIQGTLFNTRSVDVQCTLAVAKPFTYAIGSPIPLLLTLQSRDMQALDLIASRPLVQLVRTLALGSDATDESVQRRSNNTFSTVVGQAVFWPHENNSSPIQRSEVRLLRGELHVGTNVKPGFSFPRFVLKYDLNLLPPRISGFSPSTHPNEALVSQRVTITSSNAPGIIPVSHAPPGYADDIDADYNIATGFLENGDQRFFTHVSTTQQPSIHSHFGELAQKDAIQKYGIAGRVWEAAYVLMQYLDGLPDIEFDPPFVVPERSTPLTVLELGSGTGVVGIALARKLAAAGRDQDRVILTDLEDVCPLLQENLERHGASLQRLVDVRPLAWGCVEHATRIAEELGLHGTTGQRRLSHILCSDLVYFPELLAPLLRSLLHLTSAPFGTSHSTPPDVIISYKIRSLSKETQFWNAFGLWFTFTPVLERRRTNSLDSASLHARWRRFGENADTFIFIAQRREESINWIIPDDDQALLGGVGAQSTESRKSDDTFELMLLMGMSDGKDEDSQ